MTTVYPSSDGYFQQDNTPCHKAQIILDWFLEHDNEFTLLKCPPQSPDLNPIEHLWDVVEREIRIMDVQPTNLQQLCDAIMTIWTKISEECFKHLVESVTKNKKTVKAKGGPNRQWSIMRTYLDIMVGTAGYSVVERSINFPAWIGPMILTVQLLHGGVNVMWRQLHNIRKNTSVFER